MLTPCNGCGALFPPFEGPKHRYIGASAGCWALFNWSVTMEGLDDFGLIAQSSRSARIRVRVPLRFDRAEAINARLIQQ